MIVVADGDIAISRLDRQTQKPLPLGLNPFDKYQYANKQFLMINSYDAMKQNVQQDEHLILYNDLGEIDVFADVTKDIIQGVVMVNHGYWMRHINGKTVNALISNKPSNIGKGITVNDTIVFIKKPSQSQKLK